MTFFSRAMMVPHLRMCPTVHDCVWDRAPLCASMSRTVFTGHKWAGSSISGLALSLHSSLPATAQWSFPSLPSTLDGSNHSQALHPYGRQSALKLHYNITQQSFNEHLIQQHCIKGPSSLLSSEKYSTWILVCHLSQL